MVKYTLLHKPTLSTWPSLPRQVKTIIVAGIFITLTFLVLVQAARNAKLRDLYNMKAMTAEILDLEMRFMPELESEISDRWKSATVTDGMIYSAYLDSRPEIVLEDRHYDNSGENTWAVIRVIAVLPLAMKDKPLTCYLEYRGVDEERGIIQNRTASRVQPIKENWGLKYSAFFVLCDLTLPVNMDFEEFYYAQHLPLKVALANTTLANLDELQFVNVRYPEGGVNQANDDEDEFLAVCGPVLHHEYGRALHLVEFIEYQLMLGAGHIMFYNESVTPEVSQVLAHYVSRGVATVLEWKLPSIYKFELTLRVYGQFAALNDCLYRSSFHKNYKYVLVSDIDEFIVPRMHKDFKELLNFLDPPNPSGVRNQYASFQFRNVFFYLMYGDDKTNYDPDVPYLYLQAKTERVENPEKPDKRSKYIARSQDVVEMGNHFIWHHRPGTSVFSERFEQFVVDPDVALSHHYRDCEAETTGCYLRPTLIDRAAHKYVKDLGKRVRQACTDIFKESGCPAPTD
ncbi:uncharacterized protein [Neodiprion pinetum]|uniref:uncharacterized protein n=1 Tax=Neodiprion pinetum TaxID=441929 RepID=UPI001EDD8FF6|nr:uncharacterized protein LOC124222156 isoform X2 [Neodiprion pinetum]